MSVVYFNGDLLDEDEVKVSVNDAGYYYGDGIYEVILYYKGKFIDKDAHLDRLVRCMHNVHFNNVPSKDEIFDNIKKVVLNNEEMEALINGLKGHKQNYDVEVKAGRYFQTIILFQYTFKLQEDVPLGVIHLEL